MDGGHISWTVSINTWPISDSSVIRYSQTSDTRLKWSSYSHLYVLYLVLHLSVKGMLIFMFTLRVISMLEWIMPIFLSHCGAKTTSLNFWLINLHDPLSSHQNVLPWELVNICTRYCEKKSRGSIKHGVFMLSL